MSDVIETSERRFGPYTIRTNAIGDYAYDILASDEMYGRLDWISRFVDNANDERPESHSVIVSSYREGCAWYTVDLERIRYATDRAISESGLSHDDAQRQAMADIRAEGHWLINDAYAIGVVVTVEHDTLGELGSASIWGIEVGYPGSTESISDLMVAYTKDYELIAEALDEARKRVVAMRGALCGASS